MRRVIKSLLLVSCFLAILFPPTDSSTHGHEKKIDQYQRGIFSWNRDPPGPCADLSGTWYNQHGSKLILEKLGDPTYPITFGGTFRTAVHLSTCNETEKLQISVIHDLRGTATQSGLITFRVIWNKKQPLSTSVMELWTPASITTWTGQCVGCNDGQETLYTTWIMAEAQETCQDMWRANRIGQDTFKRQRQ